MKCNAAKLKKGDLYSRISYGKIKNNGYNIEIENEDGNSWSIGGSIVTDEFYIHDQFNEEQKVTKTELAEIFIRNSNIIMTVNFNKQVKEKDVISRIEGELYANEGGKIISKSEFTKRAKSIVKEALDGENRTMIGRHHGEITELGRIQFVDMEVDKDTSKSYDTRLRQVDPRTLKWLIVKNVKYILK